MTSYSGWSSKTGWTMVTIFIVLLAIASFFPFFWMILTSFKSKAEINMLPPTMFPLEWFPENYVAAWTKPESTFGRYFYNTIIIAGLGTFLQLAVCIPMAYALSHFTFPGRNAVFMLIIATMMIPGDVTTIPNFVTLRHIPLTGGNNWLGEGGQGLYDSYAGMMVPFFASAFTVFLLRQAFLSVPRDYWEASQVDGMGNFSYMTRVLLPLALPSIITASIFAFIGKWNGVMWPLLITSSESLRPLQVGLLYFTNEEGHNYHHLMAAATFTILPIVLLYLICQRWFHNGAAAAGIKG